MRFLIPVHNRPSLKVSDVGSPHLRVQLGDFWPFVLAAGLVDDGDYIYQTLNLCYQTHGSHSIRFNPTTWFGKFLLRIPYHFFLEFTTCAMYQNLWLRKPYFLQRRIRPHLFHSKTRLRIPLRKLIRHRLQPPQSPPQSTLPHPHPHKTSFHPLHITPSTPLIIRPPTIQLFGLSLPRRHPREGVG